MTTATTTRELLRAALPAPKTADEATRSVELVIATDAMAPDGIRLRIAPDAVTWPQVVPVLLDHHNAIDRMAGRLESLRFDGGQLIGRAVFTDAPAADIGWQLARSGCAVSVGAIATAFRSLPDGGDEATRWQLKHAAMVPNGADPVCVTRRSSATFWPFPIDTTPTPTTTPTTETTMATATPTTTTAAPDGVPIERTAAEIKRELDITRACQRAGVSIERTAEFVASGRPFAAVVGDLFDIMHEGLAKSPAGHPAGVARAMHGGADTSSGPLILRALSARFGLPGADPADRHIPMVDALRECLPSGDRSLPYSTIVQRAFSTSDFALALQSTAERIVLNGYTEAEQGVRALAMRKVLTDFRPVKVMRFSQFGAVSFVAEGGEYPSAEFSEEDAAILTAGQYGSIVRVTRIALANDDLSAFQTMLAEMAKAAARKEASELVARLTGITWNASNSLTGQTALNIASVSAAALKLRRQSDVDGNAVSFTPRLLLVAPEQEAAGRQLVGQWTPNTSDEVMPFPGLALEVDHNLTGGTFYLADTTYSPLALGVIGGVSTNQEEEFSTGSRAFRVQHDFGTAAVDGRSIVRVAL